MSAKKARKLYGVYGASGCGRGVMPVARKKLAKLDDAELVFIDDAPGPPTVNGHALLSLSAFLEHPAAIKQVAIAIANSKIRQQLVSTLKAHGVSSWDICADNVVCYDDVEVGEGSILCSHVTLTSNIRIGRFFHANIYSYVEHDCIIGDYVTFAPRVSCNGNIVIEDHAYIGAGALIKQGKPGEPLVIGRGAVVGMGAVVTKSVAPGATVVGNPAIEMEA